MARPKIVVILSAPEDFDEADSEACYQALQGVVGLRLYRFDNLNPEEAARLAEHHLAVLAMADSYFLVSDPERIPSAEMAVAEASGKPIATNY